LQQNNTPAAVRSWIAQPPAWCEIRPDPPADLTLAFLDPGERAAIALTQSLRADRLLMDEWEGRMETERRGLPVTGRVGVLANAHLAGLLDFEQAIVELRQTNFYVSDEVVERVRQDIARTKGRTEIRTREPIPGSIPGYRRIFRMAMGLKPILFSS
jgi:predicted nucleic acid-binding protein